VTLVAALIFTQHWVSSAIALHPPVVPVQLVTLEAPAPAPPPEAPAPIPLKPPRLLSPPKPSAKPKEPAASWDERAVLPPPAPIASAPTPAPAPAAPAPARDAPAESVAALPAAGILSSPGGSSSSGEAPAVSRDDAPATSSTAGARTAAVAPERITQHARPQGGYQARPSYPAAPRRLGVQGTTLLRVHVLADGRIGDVLVEKSAGHPDLDDAAATAVKRWRFDPARRGSESVAMWVLLPVEFKLR
jgi:protein TonB